MEIILAVFRNEDEYRKIKGDSEADRLPWSDHCRRLFMLRKNPQFTLGILFFRNDRQLPVSSLFCQ